MAHFAELDDNNVVRRVTVVGNDIETAAGPLGTNDMHIDGETWCKNFYKKPSTQFKQTSYNNNFRKQYCGKGFTYDAAKDKFIKPQPYESWALDGNDDWQAPVTYPSESEGKVPNWDEAGQQWTATVGSDNFNWDASGLTWVSA